MASAQTNDRTTPRSREATRAATREAILTSAEAQFLAKGYRGASLDEIAESAGYSKGAIYSNFASKDELFLAVSSARGERVAQPLLDALATPGSADDKLAVFADWLTTISAVDNEWILVETEFTLTERGSPEVTAALTERYRRNRETTTELIATQLGASDISPTVDAKMIAEVMLALESGLALSHAVDPTVGPNHFLEVFRVLIGYPDGVPPSRS